MLIALLAMVSVLPLLLEATALVSLVLEDVIAALCHPLSAMYLFLKLPLFLEISKRTPQLTISIPDSL